MFAVFEQAKPPSRFVSVQSRRESTRNKERSKTMIPNSTVEQSEQFDVHGENLSERVREVIHEGNVSRIIVKHLDGHTIIELPVTVGVIGAVLAP